MNFTFKKYNLILGWVAFAIALVTYTLTLEPTVSFWDCGEYISTSVKLEVGHPPGAPLYQMLGAFFAMFAKDATQIAYMANFMSALSSAFTILFLFWTISILAQKVLLKKDEVLNDAKAFAVLGSAMVGALAYTFSDSFWFSAVESEVYAMSSFLMALLFWLGLKWEAEMDEPHGNRWLLLISFVVGLSFGVHILSLLVIPPIVFLYIYKKYKIKDLGQFVLANIVAILFLAFTFKFLFPFTLKYFSAMELFFVNSVGMPFNSGSIIAGILMLVAFYLGLHFSHKKNWVTTHTIILSVLFIVIGFSSWLMLPIRANANTMINENNPSSARELLAYYNREQYGDANVFYDKYYSHSYKGEKDKDQPYRDDILKYEKDKKSGKYIIVNQDTYKGVYPNYSKKHKGFIPRMVGTSPTNIHYYKSITNIPQNSTRRPTFSENIHFMMSYQFGYMYGRYFMWNFVGRQNDEQGHLDIHNGNWLSGIPIVDNQILGPQSDLPTEVKTNQARNTYFFLPLILGLFGLFFQLKKDANNFYILLLFFAFTGLAILFYTNPKPFEPRERDYAVVGSFYVFAIWIGLGVSALFGYFKEKIQSKGLAIGITLLTLLSVPVLMGFQNWDDHNRANKYTAHLNAQAYLESCDPNAILFTIGDNDTFPLWYLQEVENVRTDIKTVNTSLFATDWYIDQMKRKSYEADPIPSQLNHEEYKYGSLDVAYHFPDSTIVQDSTMYIKDFMNWIQSDKDITYYEIEDGKKLKTYPAHILRLPVNKEAVLRTGLVAANEADQIVPFIDIRIDEYGITKNRIMMLDILANFNWERPIYFTGGSYDDEEYIWLKDYLQMDGLTYKLVPILTPYTGSPFEMGRINPDKMYKNIQKWNWGTITEGIYLDSETRKNSVNFRNALVRLSNALAEKGDTIKAVEVLDLSLEKMPANKFYNHGMLLDYVDSYYRLGQKQKARALSDTIIKNTQEWLQYFSTFEDDYFPSIYDELENNLMLYGEVVKMITKHDSEAYAQKAQDQYVEHLDLFKHLIDE
jgi:hypothetical protein